jgi:hypothetical protein
LAYTTGMKLKLDVDLINEDYFADTHLLGIVAPIKNYQMVWRINKHTGFTFRLNTEAEIVLQKKQRKYHFSIYEAQEKNSCLQHFLYHNHCDGEYLLPEFKHIDFLWLLKNDIVATDYIQWIKESIKKVTPVQLVVELTHEQIKNKGNMII